MSPARIATLVGAAVLTALATIGSIDHWALAPFLRTAAIGSWIVFAGATGTDHILGAIAKLRADIDTYGDHRQSDGVIDGMNRIPPQPNLQRIR